MASPTTNRAMTYFGHGLGVNAWDAPLNADFENIDLGFGGNYPITIISTAATATYNSSYAAISSTVATVTLPSSLALNMRYPLTGTQTRNIQIVFPSSVGGFYSIVNGSSGSFTTQVITATAGSTGPFVTQGKRMWVVSNGTDVQQADNNQVAAIYTQLGSPTSNVAGTAGATSGSVSDMVWDATNRVKYVATTTGTTATTVWTPASPNYPSPMGYLTPTTGVPIITADVTSANLFYTPYKGNWLVLANGAATYPAQFSQMTLSLSAVGATNIYDVFAVTLSSAIAIGYGPSWTVGGGSITAGSGARGTGAGSTQLSYLNGILVNTVTMTVTNGSSSPSISSGAGVYLGSIYTSSAGTVTCNRTYGQNRVWGVYNGYNKNDVLLKCGITSSTWNYGSTSYRVSNNSTGFSVVSFSGLAEDIVSYSLNEMGYNPGGNSAGVGIGINSTNTASGFTPWFDFAGGGAEYFAFNAVYTPVPSLGINTAYSLERADTGTTSFGRGPDGTSVSEATFILSARFKG